VDLMGLMWGMQWTLKGGECHEEDCRYCIYRRPISASQILAVENDAPLENFKKPGQPIFPGDESTCQKGSQLHQVQFAPEAYR